MSKVHGTSGALVGAGSSLGMSTSPDQFLDRARGLLAGLEALAPLGPRVAQAAIFLASWCLELTLKAYLESNNLTKDKLRSIQHDLSALWTKAAGHGLSISATAPHWCVILSKTHNKPFHQRYPTDAAGSIAPNIQTLVTELTALQALVMQSL